MHSSVLATAARVQARLPAAQGAGGCGAGDLAKQCLLATIGTPYTLHMFETLWNALKVKSGQGLPGNLTQAYMASSI